MTTTAGVDGIGLRVALVASVLPCALLLLAVGIGAGSSCSSDPGSTCWPVDLAVGLGWVWVAAGLCASVVSLIKRSSRRPVVLAAVAYLGAMAAAVVAIVSASS